MILGRDTTATRRAWTRRGEGAPQVRVGADGGGGTRRGRAPPHVIARSVVTEGPADAAAAAAAAAERGGEMGEMGDAGGAGVGSGDLAGRKATDDGGDASQTRGGQGVC